VRRRLWPVAVLLVAALAAVPVLLARDAAPVDTPPLPQTAAPAENANAKAADDNDAFAEPVVAKASASDRSRRRRVLGSRKNPFEPAPVKKPKKSKADDESDTPAKPDEPAGPTTTPGIPAPVVTNPVTPAPVKKTYAKGTLIVRFGDPTAGDLDRMALSKLGALPKEDDDVGPLLVYTGLTDHGKKAVFLVDASLEPTGDGKCEPHPSNCETVELAKGETEFFDVIDPETGDVTAQFELDLVDIK
jgi:hypothetical protein